MLKEHSELWSQVFSDKYFEGASAAMINLYRNSRKVRLSDIAIDRRKFNYWKTEGLFDNLSMKPQDGGWLLFDGVDEMALLLVGRLWEFGFDLKLLKPTLNFLFDDSLIKEDVALYLEINRTVEVERLFNPAQPDLLSFFIKENSNVRPLINNLEFLMLLIAIKSIPVSMIFDANKNLNTLIGDKFINLVGDKHQYDFFKETFLNVSLNEFYDNIYVRSKEQDEETFMNMLKRASLPNDKECTMEVLSTDVNFSLIIKEHPNQDILIKVRNKKKFEVSRIIITSKKQ